MQDLFRQHVETIAHYDAWANARLFDAAGLLSDADYRAKTRRVLRLGPWHAQ
jgi:hypothetical protein